MKAKYLTFFLIFIFPLTALTAFETLPESSEGQLIVNNRILARVQNKNISVLDVMKKMEINLIRDYPQYANSTAARYQFFSAHWKQTLFQIIDQELMMADFEDLGEKANALKVSDAEVREELYDRFGPNVSETLDKLDVTHDEAWQMIYSEIATQRMMGIRVGNKAMQRMSAQEIKLAYQKYCETNPPEEIWKYQVLTIRSKDQALGQMLAQKIGTLLSDQQLDFQQAAQQVQQEPLEPTVTINVSNDYEVSAKDLSDSHKTILATLKPHTYSKAISQFSRFDQSDVQRIFYLKEHTVKKQRTFKELYDELQNQLFQEAARKESELYITKLRERFNFDEKEVLDRLPANFQPFILSHAHL